MGGAAKQKLAVALMLVTALPGATVPAVASARGAIETACLRSERPSAGGEICACLQRVADTTLTRGDQRRGAIFFADPHKAQQAKASGRAEDRLFWVRWEVFAASAVKHCQ